MCNPITDPLGCAADAVAGTFADQMREGAKWVIETTVGWWIKVPAIDLAASPVDQIRSFVLPLAVLTAVAGVLWQGLRMTVTRKPDPLLDIGRGLWTVALWSAVGVIGPAAALKAGDSFSSWVLERAADGGAADRLVGLASMNGVSAPGAVIVFGLFMMLAGLLQAILMIFREGSLVILAGVIVLAASGSLTRSTRPWLQRVLGWMLALICYKPAAALVYGAALTLAGEGDDPRTVVVGMTMLALSLIALPVLMKLFTWAAGRVEGSGGAGMAALAGASAAGIHAAAAMRGGPSTGGGASAQAQRIRDDLGPAAGPLASGSGGAPPPNGAGPTGGPPPAPTGSGQGSPAGGGAAQPSATAAGGTAAAGGASAAAGGAVVAGVHVVKAAADQAAKATTPSSEEGVDR